MIIDERLFRYDLSGHLVNTNCPGGTEVVAKSFDFYKVLFRIRQMTLIL